MFACAHVARRASNARWMCHVMPEMPKVSERARLRMVRPTPYRRMIGHEQELNPGTRGCAIPRAASCSRTCQTVTQPPRPGDASALAQKHCGRAPTRTREGDSSTCSKAPKILKMSMGRMPQPVSRTNRKTEPPSSLDTRAPCTSLSGSKPTPTRTRPRRVNLHALDSRLKRTCAP